MLARFVKAASTILLVTLIAGCGPVATKVPAQPTQASTGLAEQPSPTAETATTTVPTVAPSSTHTATSSPESTPTATQEVLLGPWLPVLPGEPCIPSATRFCKVLFVLPPEYYAKQNQQFPQQFRDAGYTVVTAAACHPEAVEVCRASWKDGLDDQAIPVDMPLEQVQVADYDAIVYIGGYGCQSQWEDDGSHRIAREAVAQGVILGAAGCAPTILGHAGVLEGKLVVVCSTRVPVKHGLNYCEVLEELGAICSRDLIVRDGLIVTAKQHSAYFVAGVIEVIGELKGQP